MTKKTAAASTPKGKPRLPKAGAGKKPEGTQALAEASIVPAMSVTAPRIVDGAMSVHRATASMPMPAPMDQKDAAPIIAPENFDGDAYLDANPDVAYAIKAGEFASVYEHYRLHGAQERRPLRPASYERFEPIVYEYGSTDTATAELQASVDVCVVSWLGGIFIVGWMDDSILPVDSVRVVGTDFHIELPARMLIRVRRVDVEGALGRSDRYRYGFCGLFHCVWSRPAGEKLTVEFRSKSLIARSIDASAQVVDKVGLRDIAMSYLATTQFFGNPDVERIEQLGNGFGGQAVRLNHSIISDVVKSPYVERFSQGSHRYKGSIVVCLYGKSEFYFLQQALYAGLPGLAGYEFVYVCNSPEISESLLKEAHAAQRIYGLPSTVIILGGNAGFGAANNVAVRHSRSGRALIVNPDVFPRNRDWALNHTRMIESLPDAQTRIFGSTLYYDDGSLMHGGMYFDQDIGLNMSKESPSPIHLMRVEHYGKGAADAAVYTKSRPVPAVTGAFISIDRAWYEKLGGFTEDFVFGHYEDADLCLKSLEQGYPSYIHDLDLWHLEGKGSSRKLPHEGGSSVNRWLFAEKWGRTIQRGLIGLSPTHRFLDIQSTHAP